MTDITNTHLEAAIIDQHVAGSFADKVYAFTVVIGDGGWQLGVAVANESGYHPISGKTFKGRAEADEWADRLNAHIGRDKLAALHIVGSTMGGNRVEVM
jgi:hypothetical protein